jgi:hypothetical protein
VDANPAMNELSRKLMEEADITVINLSQNIGILDMFLNTFRESIDSKVFYLFGNYDSNSKYNIRNIRRKYKDITISNSGVIPYNTGYKDAQIESKVIEFLRKNLYHQKSSENCYFIMKSTSVAEKILKLAGMKQVIRKDLV